MDALQMTLLFDYYGDLLTERQRMCIDMRYNQDMSLGEIAQELKQVGEEIGVIIRCQHEDIFNKMHRI